MGPPKAGLRLTNARIDSLRPRSARYEIGDPSCAGLQLRVAETGVKSWHWRFYWGKKAGERKRERLVLGTWPAVGLADAHEKVSAARTLLRRGIDPRRSGLTAVRAKAEPVPSSADAHSVAHLAQEFMARHVKPRRRRPEYVQRILDREILPRWDTRDVRTIKPREVVELLDEIVDRGSRVMANRVAGVLSQMFRFGIHRALVEASPVQLLYRPGGKEKPRQRSLSDTELRAFLKDPTAATRFQRLAHVIPLLLLTGQRRGELALARWAEIDYQARTWTIPDENAKGGRGHVVPLTDAAIAEFHALQRHAKRSKWVLPANGGEHHIDPKQLTRSLAKCQKRFKEVGITSFTLHDLRRTCRTGLSRLKVLPHIAERVLNHVQGKIEGTYDLHAYLDEKRAALEQWAVHVEALRP